MKKVKGMKVTVYDTGIEYCDPVSGYDEGRHYLLYVTENAKNGKTHYDFVLGVEGIAFWTEMFGLGDIDREEALAIAEENLCEHIVDYDEQLADAEDKTEMACDFYTRKYDFCKNALLSIYARTDMNCAYYESKNDDALLLNEIGVLRGISYAIEALLNENQMFNMIGLEGIEKRIKKQEELKKKMKG